MKGDIIDEMIEYISYGNPIDIKWDFMQIDGNESLEEIANKITPKGTAQRFSPATSSCVKGKPILNDYNVFIVGKEWPEIWQIGAKLTDMHGDIIPGIIRVRRIGEIR